MLVKLKKKKKEIMNCKIVSKYFMLIFDDFYWLIGNYGNSLK